MIRGQKTVAMGLLLVGVILTARSSFATPIGPDTFSSGTTLGWGVGSATNPNQPAVVSTGGPGGAGDAFLQLASNAGLIDAGSRLSVFNTSQWTGDYLAAGITAITMDVNNFGPDDLTLRLLLTNFDPFPTRTDMAWTLAPVFVPAGSGWMHVTFALDAANLFAPLGTAVGALADVNELRLFHNPNAAFDGPPNSIPHVTATLGIDNITPVRAVTAVPEPSMLLLLTPAVGWFIARHRQR